MTADPVSPRRRFQFRLRTLLIGMTLLAVPCGYMGWQAKIVRERAAMLKDPHFFLSGIRFEVAGTIPWIRCRLGDIECLGIIGDEHVSDADLERYRLAFPEADIWREGDRPERDGVNFHFPDKDGQMRSISERRVHASDLDHLKAIYGSK